MSNILNQVMANYKDKVGIADTDNFPDAGIIIDLSEKEYFKNIRKKIFKLLPENSKYHFPKMLPNIDGYKTFQSPMDLDRVIDFSSIYYLDDPISKIDDLSDIFEDKDVHSLISGYYKNNFETSFGIYHISIYRNFKTNSAESGYLKWHNDTFPVYIKKLLIYLDDILEEADGPTQIKLPDGTVKSIFGKAGTAIFFDMNSIHRGYQIQEHSKNHSRSVMYFSLCPYDIDYVVPLQALGTDVIYPLDLNKAFTNSIKKQHAYPVELENKKDVVGINIGGGNFNKDKWINFDIRYTNLHEQQFFLDLSKKIRLPIESASIGYAYTSHCIEHLRDDAVDYIFFEMARVLKKGGQCLIKIPDFEGVVNAYFNRDFSFFINKWGIEGLHETMQTHDIDINLTNYMLLIFCGYRDFGAGSVYGNKKSNKFIGPPRISKEVVDDALRSMSIKDFSKFVVAQAKDVHDFIHLNAFTPGELIKKAKMAGMKPLVQSFQNCESEVYDEFKRELGTDVVTSLDSISYYLLLEKI
jgi:SAM-dependent methyltransferase